MKKKEIESFLSNFETFQTPKYKLEQYETPSHLSIPMIEMINYNDEIGDSIIFDLGCGTGLLSAVASLYNPEMIYGIDIDHDCLEIAQNNFNDLNVPTEFIQMDIGDSSFNSKFRSNVNPIVIMNPPFGTKVKGIDLLFLKFAADLNPKSIYSLHKSTTTKHLIKKAVQYNLTGNVLAKLNYDLYSTFNFHKSKCVNIDVDFIKWNLN